MHVAKLQTIHKNVSQESPMFKNPMLSIVFKFIKALGWSLIFWVHWYFGKCSYFYRVNSKLDMNSCYN